MTRRHIDWEAIEPHYRAGIRSLKDIGAQFGVSDAAIIKRAKKDKWPRDLTAKIKAKADAKVSAATVSAQVSAQTKITEQITVEVEAEVQSRIRLAHRADITRLRALVLRLIGECEAEASDPKLFHELGEMLRSKDDGPDRLNEAYMKAISLPQRIKGVKELAEAMRILVGMEREAYGIDQSQPTGTFEQTLMEIHEATRA